MADLTHNNLSLKGQLLLADPKLREPTFCQSVLLLTEHSDEHGALGFILNRPFGKSVGEFLPDLEFEELKDAPVFMGGPVSTEHLTFAALGWSEMESKLQFATHLSGNEAMMYQMEGFEIRAYVGYSGWSEGQLESELEQKTWIIHEAEKIVIDAKRAEQLWRDILREISPWYRIVADEPDDTSMN
ncbi:MAG: YqgE/AlgH family protein [Verrucomicrobiota bacterium]